MLVYFYRRMQSMLQGKQEWDGIMNMYSMQENW